MSKSKRTSTELNLAIRTDGNAEIGLGHLVRCISLAHMLKEAFAISFYCKSIPESLKEEILKEGWSLKKLKSESDFEKELTGHEIMVLDGYHFDSAYQKQIKGRVGKLVCIDDFHNQYIYADLVINHAPGVTKEDYEGEPYTKYLLGTDYALLRPEFINIEKREKEYPKKITNVFICFGGSDSKNLTAKVLSWIPSESYSVTIVVGNAYEHRDELNRVINNREDLEVATKNSLSAVEMRNELEQSELAIVPASGILFEAISTGLPVISGYYTANQKDVYSGFKNINVFYDAKSFSKENFLEAFNNAFRKVNTEMVDNQWNCIDKLSPKRFRNKFLGLSYSLFLLTREANLDDIKQYFEWANDESVRANAFNSENILWKDHVSWFKQKLSNNQTKMYIFEIGEKGVGQIRFDKKNDVWDIDYMLDENFRGFGLGTEVVDRGLKKMILEEKKIKAQALVKSNNIPSIKVFEDLGFKKQNYKEGTEKFIYEEKL